ncbi:aspartyl protease family protein [Sphingomonas baiyangensis]|uniref:PDZ domain-containing protein n=1 Tax=Sphingomonas baiyangensis TaxID=2572576 RepID=A0A4U1L388_9SPHN|nr:aspartyl protease family protein [Sphingomonas baiyangensis]TKD51339.1 hypothetical protein FBR43_11685 [Sphingomonas baiyangensis]
MRAVAILAGLLLVGAASPVPPQRTAAPPPATDVMLARDTDTRWVPFELTPGNQLRFDLEIDGRRASAILDTGVSYTVASRAFAGAAGLTPASGRQRADAVGGAVPIGWAAIERIGFGGLTRTGGRVAIVDLKAIATGSAAPVDLLVGSDILSCCALDIDFDAGRFRLLPSGRLPFPGASAPLSLSPQSRVFVSEATIAGRRVRPLIVDTGDGAALTLSRGAWNAVGVKPAGLTSAVAFGLGGTIRTDMTILPTLAVGAQPMREIELRIEPKAGFSDQTSTAGRIGSGLLQRYRVLMDPRAGHMVFAPGTRAAAPPIRSTSGLLVGYDTGRLRVLHVMRGSPAAAAGWQDGEQICTVDDVPVPTIADGSVDTAWSAGEPGRVIRFGMCDGATRTLTLRRFY